MRATPALTARYYAVIVIIAVIGVAAAGYVLANQGQGAPSPFKERYTIRAELAEANGVLAGIGQPVNVAGVEVGVITGTDLNEAGNAVLELEIRPEQLPRVHANASAFLRPITPLKDMSLELDPGAPPAPVLQDGAVLDVGRTSTAADLSRTLAALDSDTRDFLSTFINGLGAGTAGQGMNLQRLFAALGPTTGQVRRISRSLAKRRTGLRRLVTNLGHVMKAASPDRDLARVVVAGNETLGAVASQEAPLREAIKRLPGTLQTTRTMLDEAAGFADALGPAVRALRPAAERLPRTLDALGPFADSLRTVVAKEVRPLVREARPVLRDLGPATVTLNRLTPDVARVVQSLNYLLNVLAYNAPGDDEGGLFWTAWFAHDWLSTWSLGDAHGILGRAMVMASCQQLTSVTDTAIAAVLAPTVGLSTLCPK